MEAHYVYGIKRRGEERNGLAGSGIAEIWRDRRRWSLSKRPNSAVTLSQKRKYSYVYVLLYLVWSNVRAIGIRF